MIRVQQTVLNFKDNEYPQLKEYSVDEALPVILGKDSDYHNLTEDNLIGRCVPVSNSGWYGVDGILENETLLTPKLLDSLSKGEMVMEMCGIAEHSFKDDNDTIVKFTPMYVTLDYRK